MEFNIKQISNGYLVRTRKIVHSWGYIQPGTPDASEAIVETCVPNKQEVLKMFKDFYGIPDRGDLPEYACYSCALRDEMKHPGNSSCSPQGVLVNSPFYPNGCDSWEAE